MMFIVLVYKSEDLKQKNNDVLGTLYKVFHKYKSVSRNC